jgi:putative MATE family efflux protein
MSHFHTRHHTLHPKHHLKPVDEDIKKEILEDDIWKLFKKLAIPAIFGMLMYAVYIFVDAIFVGQWVGKDGIAAISIVYPLTLVNMAISAFIGMGSASVLSRAMGSGDNRTISKILGNNSIFLLISSIIFAVIGYVFASHLISFLGGSGSIKGYAVDYFRIVVAGSFFINFIGASIMLIMAEGKPKAAMGIIMTGSMLNIILDPIFIKGLNLGITGAAIATVLAMTVTTVITLHYFLSGKSVLTFSRKHFRISEDLMKKLAPVGAAGMGMQIIVVIQQVILFRSISIYGGGNELAIIGATLNMMNFAMIPMYGISQGLQPVAGMNYGAKKIPRVKEALSKFLIASVAISFAIWVLFMAFPEAIIGIYITDSSVAEQGAGIFRIILIAFFIYGVKILTATLFESIGKGGLAGLVLLIPQVILFVPLIIILPWFMGIDGIWWSIPAAEAIAVIIILMIITYEFKIIGVKKTEGSEKTKKVKSHAVN